MQHFNDKIWSNEVFKFHENQMMQNQNYQSKLLANGSISINPIKMAV